MAKIGDSRSPSPPNAPPARENESPSDKGSSGGALADVPITRSADHPISRSSDAASMLCCYNLPDYRLEHTDFVVQRIEPDREAAVAAPMPAPETTPLNVYCNGCHDIQLKGGAPRTRAAQEPAGS